MKIAVSVYDSYQCSTNESRSYIKTYVFEDTVTIAEILKTTGQKEIGLCILSSIVKIESEEDKL